MGSLGMTKDEVEKVLNTPYLEEISPDNANDVTAFYQDDGFYEIGYYDGEVYNVKESETR